MDTYYTLLIPYSEHPTEWHPTEKFGPFAILTRGAFGTEADAHAWARANLAGQSYAVRTIYARAALEVK